MWSIFTEKPRTKKRKATRWALLLAFLPLLEGCFFSKEKAPEKPIPGHAPEVTLSQLLEARTVLRASLESENLCKIPQEELAQLPQLLEAEINQQLSAHRMLLKDADHVKGCAARCDCDWFREHEAMIPEPNAEQKVAYAAARKAAPRLKASDVLSCAKKSLWICESDLLKSLRSQTAR